MSKEIRVCAVIPGEKDGSLFPFSREQVSALMSEGIHIETYYFAARMSVGGIIRAVRDIVSLVKGARCNIIHAHYGTITALVCAMAAILTHTRLVLTFHGSDLNPTPVVDGYARDFAQRMTSNVAALFSDRIICVSHGLKNRLWWRRDTAIVVPCGVNLSVFYPQDRKISRETLGLSPSAKYVVFNNGNRSLVKREDLAIAAVAIVQSTMPETELLVLRNIEAKKVPIYLSAANCLIICSDSEGSPTILKEAMACNLPVVSVDVGDVSYQLQGVTGAIIADKTPAAIASGILRILSGDVPTNGRERIAGRLDSATIAGQVRSCYLEMVS